MAGSAHDRFDFPDWWWLVKWDVHVYDPRSQTTKTHVMEYPGTSRAEGAAVTAYASRDLRKKMDHILVVPHHETSGRSEPQPKKSHAQIKREVDEILRSGPHRGSSGKSHLGSVRKGSGEVPHSFIAKIWSTGKWPLLGGVMRTESSPFSHREDAESFLVQSIETNAGAGRAATGEVVLSHKRPAITRHAATGELVARKHKHHGHATKITPRPFYEIQSTDIGKRFLRAFGRGWSLSDVLGYVQRGDVGKRLYLVDGILQVENNEQRDARVRKSS